MEELRFIDNIDIIKQHLNILYETVPLDGEESGSTYQFSSEDNYLTMLWNACLDAVEKYIDDSLDDIATAYSGSLPTSLIQATLLLVGNYYNTRESNTYASVKEVPLGFTFLCDLWRNYAGNQRTAQEVINELSARVEALEEYVEFDRKKAIESTDSIEATTTVSGITTLEVTTLDGGEY